MEFSKYQQDIFDFVQKGEGSGVIIAVAGSGKTTVIVECARRIPEDQAVTFLAFNKSIAMELGGRLPAHVKAQTLNSMGFRALMKYLGGGRCNLDARKTLNIVQEYTTPETRKLFGAGVRKLVGLAKAHGILPAHMPGVGLMLDTEQNWVGLIDRYDVEFEGNADPLEGIKIARKVLVESIKIGMVVVDFDDQLYLPVIWQAKFWQHDLIFVDECQDVNPIQRAMIRMALKPEGRGIFVGDPAQAIYGFRGADTESIAHIKEEFAAKEFPLSVSYRCPRSVVQAAQSFVPYIEASPTAPEGKVMSLSKFTTKDFDSHDAILCRNTNPLIAMAFALMKNLKPCKVLGRDIGQGLVRLIHKMDSDNIDDLEEALTKYQTREIRKLVAKGKEDQASVIEDRVASIWIFIGELAEDKRTIQHLEDLITGLFKDVEGNGMLILATIHKAKGLEWDRVFILDPFLMPSRWARQQWQKEQEGNIQYVAYTRAKSELCFINSKDFGGNHDENK